MFPGISSDSDAVLVAKAPKTKRDFGRKGKENVSMLTDCVWSWIHVVSASVRNGEGCRISLCTTPSSSSSWKQFEEERLDNICFPYLFDFMNYMCSTLEPYVLWLVVKAWRNWRKEKSTSVIALFNSFIFYWYLLLIPLTSHCYSVTLNLPSWSTRSQTISPTTVEPLALDTAQCRWKSVMKTLSWRHTLL